MPLIIENGCYDFTKVFTDDLTPVAKRFDKQAECGRRLPTAGVIEVIAREGRAPIGEHPDQPPIGQLCSHLVFRQIGEPESGHHGVHPERHGVEHQLPFDPHLQSAPAFLEFPGVDAAIGRQANIDAFMRRQLLGCFGRGRLSKYEGAPTTAMCTSGPIRTATMSFATCSPRRTPAS